MRVGHPSVALVRPALSTPSYSQEQPWLFLPGPFADPSSFCPFAELSFSHYVQVGKRPRQRPKLLRRVPHGERIVTHQKPIAQADSSASTYTYSLYRAPPPNPQTSGIRITWISSITIYKHILRLLFARRHSPFSASHVPHHLTFFPTPLLATSHPTRLAPIPTNPYHVIGPPRRLQGQARTSRPLPIPGERVCLCNHSTRDASITRKHTHVQTFPRPPSRSTLWPHLTDATAPAQAITE